MAKGLKENSVERNRFIYSSGIDPASLSLQIGIIQQSYADGLCT